MSIINAGVVQSREVTVTVTSLLPPAPSTQPGEEDLGLVESRGKNKGIK
jgi:hypothetical protein